MFAYTIVAVGQTVQMPEDEVVDAEEVVAVYMIADDALSACIEVQQGRQSHESLGWAEVSMPWIQAYEVRKIPLIS